ncbi:dethiobiotin synthase [Thioalkalicoccus limnaeus]|uniref:ATP-dependent dethiobiotin synthetase BioD n=1 Tax=Thioalkalicoccus limnaeus TaxID=120681 RepID=A0ABV4BJE2_9GAMM
MTGLFVTGTDTGCGKTEIALALMAAMQAHGRVVLGMKPVASGCEPTPDGLRNPDACRLREQGSCASPYRFVNPYAFGPPIAPHLAAAQVGCRIDLAVIEAAYAELANAAERVIVEGVGGWRVPLGPNLAVGDLPRALGLPVVLVVGLRLGCLNHGLLTAEAIVADGLHLAGWIGNQVDPDMDALAGNVATLTERIPAPCLGLVPWCATPSPVAWAEFVADGLSAHRLI